MKRVKRLEGRPDDGAGLPHSHLGLLTLATAAMHVPKAGDESFPAAIDDAADAPQGHGGDRGDRDDAVAGD